VIELLSIMFKIHDGFWFRSMPRLGETIPPPNIQPFTRPTWKYVNPASLGTSGIYSSDDLDLGHIIFLVEKPSMLNTIAKGAMRQCISEGSISLNNFLDKKSLDKITESAEIHLWNIQIYGFVIFKSASAGVLVVFIIVHQTNHRYNYT